MTSYRHFDTLLHHAGHGARLDRKRIGNNTWAERRDDETIAIRLHATDIITLNLDGRVTLNTGGWYTVTTKARMNEYAPLVRVYSVKAVWHVRLAGSDLPYVDGFSYHEETGLIYTGAEAFIEAEEQAHQSVEIKARVKEYLDGFGLVEAQRVLDALSEPNGTAGDCWFCLLETEEGKPWGDSAGDHGHLASHVEERYYVPTLIVRAYQERGYRDWRLPLSIDLQTAARGERYGLKAIRHNLRRYLLDRLLVGATVSR